MAVLLQKHLFSNCRPLGACNSYPQSSCHTLCHLSLLKSHPQSALYTFTKTTECGIYSYSYSYGACQNSPVVGSAKLGESPGVLSSATSQVTDGHCPRIVKYWEVNHLDRNLSQVDCSSLWSVVNFLWGFRANPLSLIHGPAGRGLGAECIGDLSL